LLLLLLAAVLAAHGQGGVVGRVVTRAGVPVAGVHARWEEGDAGATSDSLGHFRLACRVPCTILLSHVAYRDERVHVTGDEAPFVVVLRDRDNRLDEVIVTGVPAGGSVHSTSRHIERVPAILGEQDILKYLATLPGVVTTNPFNAGIYVRGGDNHENAFLVNDMPIASPGHLTGILATFDPYVLGSATLYKSGFPARYNGYLSSYLNMRPDAGNKERHEGEATLGIVSSSLKARGPLVKRVASYVVSARSSYLRQIARLYNRSAGPSGAAGLMPEYAFHDFTAVVDARPSARWRFSGFALLTLDDMEMKLSEHARYRFRWNTFSGNLLSAYTSPSGDLWTLQAGVKSAFSEGSASGNIPMGGGNRYRTFMSRLSYARTFPGGSRLQAGARAEHDRFETANREDGHGNLLFRSSDKEFILLDAYLDLSLRAGDRLTLDAGLNFQRYAGETRATVLSPRLKLTAPVARFTLWIDYAASAQYLGLYPYFTVKTPVDIWYPLSEENRPATCHQLSLGARREVGHVTAYAGLFYKKMKHVKDFTREPGTGYVAAGERQIEGTGRARGLELDLSFLHRGTSARANYTLSSSTRAFAAINDGRAFSPPYDVKHNVVLTLSRALSPRLTFNALWTYSSGVHTTLPAGIVLAHNLTDVEDKPVIIPVYRERYNYRLPDNHRLDAALDHLSRRGPFTIRVSAGAYNIYNHPNPSFVYFRAEEGRSGYQRLLPASKVILPFIPYVSLRLNW
jgi:hypothetical protein